MSIEMLQCPHCDTRVIPMADGICPACRANTDQPPAPDPNDHGEARETWDRYKDSLHPGFVETSVTGLHEIERPYLKSRAEAVPRLKHYAMGDPEFADQVRQELLPRFVTAIQQIQDTGEEGDVACLVAFAKLREESWRSLADALAENDPDKLEHHEELWGRSELLIRSIEREAESPGTATKCIKEFQQGLSTFTPHVIATWAIILVNILVFAAMAATGAHVLHPTIQTVLDWGANFGPATANGQWWRLVTCMFLHFGIIHLGFNMWVLRDLGRLVERLVGNAGFLILYFVSGISGSLASLSWHPLVISGGASGAVFGVVGALLGLIAFRRDTIPAPVLKHLSKIMTVFVVYNILFGIVVPGIDVAAHIGGFVAGLACGLILSQPLTRKMVVRRKGRNAVVAFAGAAAIVLWTSSLPNSTRTAFLPTCTDPDVVKLLEKTIRTSSLSTKFKSIANHRELSYDSDAEVRQGKCVARTDEGPITLRYVVEWHDSSKLLFQVRILAAELPECADPMVVKLLEQVFQSTHPDVELNRLDGHREVRYDSDAGVRYGECVANTDAGKVPVRYVVEWPYPKDGNYQVRILPDELPSCTDAEVVKMLDQVIREELAGIDLQSIDGHREVAYDDTIEARHGECIAHTDAGQLPIRFVVEWQNRPRGIYQVQLVAAPQ